MGRFFPRCESLRSGPEKHAAICQKRCFAQADLGQCESTRGTPQTAHTHSGVTPPKRLARGHWREPARAGIMEKKGGVPLGKGRPEFRVQGSSDSPPVSFLPAALSASGTSAPAPERMVGRDSLTTLTTRDHWQRGPASPPQGCLVRRSADPRPAGRQASGNRQCPWSCRSGGPSGQSCCRHGRWPSRAPRCALPSR